MNRPTVPSFLFASVLTFAAIVVWSLCASWIGEIAANLSDQSETYEQIEIRRDGQPIISRVFTDNYGHQSAVTYRTIDGTPIETEERDTVVTSNLAAPWNPRNRFERMLWINRIEGFAVGSPPPGGIQELWYFVHDGKLDGRGYAVGYRGDTRGLIGYIGVKGFSASPPPRDEQLAVSGPLMAQTTNLNQTVEPWYSIPNSNREPLFATANGALFFDFLKRDARLFFKGEDTIDVAPIRGTVANLRDPTPLWRHRLVVRTKSRLHVFDSERVEQYSVNIPESIRDFELDAVELPNGGILAIASRDRYRDTRVTKVAWLGRDGGEKIVAVDLIWPKREGTPWPRIGWTISSPAGLAMAWLLGAGRAAVGNDGTESWGDGLAQEWPRFWPTLLAALVISGGLAAWVYRRQRHYYVGHEVLWAAFVLIAGPFGALAYWAHRYWPILERCASCGAMAPRDREACAGCNAEFPPPVRLSTEIRA